MGWYKAKCENCRGAEILSDTLRSYVLPDGATLDIESSFGYCTPCAKAVWIEKIPSPGELEARLDSASSENSRRLNDIRVRILWRKTRLSPPRCLHCGSCDIVPALAGETRSGNRKWEMPCPRCEGRIRVFQEPVLALDRGWVHYSSEGALMQGYEMSPSKSAVPSKRTY